MPVSRRQFIKATLGAGALAVMAGCGLRRPPAAEDAGPAAPAAGADTRPQTPAAELSADEEAWLDRLNSAVVSGGPPKDGIPPIDRPAYVGPEEADKWLADDQVVFGVDHRGVVAAYPQLILVWHEIVNDQFEGEPASVTYCPLTGSAVGFVGRSPEDGRALTFGTTGRLVNSNLLMYDRPTDSEWPQIFGTAIEGPARGRALELFPVVWTRWGLWKARHPKTRVLSASTGHVRPYGRDPYGSYQEIGNYYDSGGPFFPVLESDRRFGPKTVVMGLRAGGKPLAILKSAVRTERAANLAQGDIPLVALYDEALDTVRVFERRADGRVLTLEPSGAGDAAGPDTGAYADAETGSAWSVLGRAVDGPLKGTALAEVVSFDVMWFAWYAFYPGTEVYVGDE